MLKKCRNVLTDSSSGIFLAGNFPPVCVCTRTPASVNAVAEAPLSSTGRSSSMLAQVDICPSVYQPCPQKPSLCVLIQSPAGFFLASLWRFLSDFSGHFVFVLLGEIDPRVEDNSAAAAVQLCRGGGLLLTSSSSFSSEIPQTFPLPNPS